VLRDKYTAPGRLKVAFGRRASAGPPTFFSLCRIYTIRHAPSPCSYVPDMHKFDKLGISELDEDNLLKSVA
jgi:hypothetical protein